MKILGVLIVSMLVLSGCSRQIEAHSLNKAVAICGDIKNIDYIKANILLDAVQCVDGKFDRIDT